MSRLRRPPGPHSALPGKILIDFLRNPLSWLTAISRYNATIITAPTFAFELCARRLEEALPDFDNADLDLSNIRVAIVGAEMVRATTLTRFAAATSAYGFSSSAFHPCYGLAEHTLFVDGVRGPLPRITRHVAPPGERGHWLTTALRNRRRHVTGMA